jgi:hypothetical protein
LPLADYDVLREIHRDQLAVWRLARERAGGRLVMLTSITADAAAGARLRGQIETIARLEHPSIAPVRDVFEEDGRVHVATDFIEGRSLRELMGELSPAQAARVIEDVLAAVGAAAAAGVLHLELRPENVLVAADGRALVTGFGTASVWSPPRPSATDAGGMRDVSYLAPEQVLASQTGPETDLYAIGCMAYELLTGRPPFRADAWLDLAMRHVDTPLPDPREVDATIPEPVARWVARMTEKAPADRFAGAAVARAALRDALAQIDAPEQAEPAADELLAGLRRRARAGAAVRHVSGQAVAVGPPPVPPGVEAPAPAPDPPAPAPAPYVSLPPEPPPAPALPRDYVVIGRDPVGDVVVTGDRAPPAPLMRGRGRLLVTLAKLAGLAAVAAAAGRLLGLFTIDVEVEAQCDVVDCTVFAPPAAVAGEPILVQAFVHLPVQEADARALATEFDAAATRRAVQGLETEVPRGATLHFGLRIPGAVVEEPAASLVWRGRPAAVAFGVTVPAGSDARTLIATVDVTQDSIPIGHVRFKLDVLAERAGEPPEAEPAGLAASRYRTAFLSYAREDRDAAIRGAQMLRSVGIAFFQDVVDLDPGERWERRLYREIERSDLFLLFWSRAARDSTWVRKEALWALDCLGDELDERPEIKPVILERPPSAPWPELAHLHFDDPLAYFAGPETGP